MNKKKIAIISSVALVAIIIICIIFIPFFLDIINKPISDKSEEVLIVIEENSSVLAVGKTLENNGIIRSRSAFALKVKSSGKSIKSGTYVLNKNMSLEEIIKKLSEKKEIIIKSITVTFPEGYTVEQMAKLLEKKGLTTEEEFLKALNDDYEFDFISQIPDGNYNYKLQGFLFPSTYEFYENSTAHDIVHKMLNQFNTLYKSNNGNYENVFETITKASMIEKEAKTDVDRALIAEVIENRIKKNMAFQIDATVLYAATNGLYNKSESTYIAQQIETLDSPYNTYKYAGLPAGPICNPGLASINAALSPESHNYLYYHTDTSKNDGSHIFSETYDEHVSTLR